MPEDISLIKTTLLHDQPIPSDYTEGDDGLGFHAYAKILAGAALSTPSPFTIGIFGEWGTGKTSLMQMVKGLLDAQVDEDVVTVWFDAWLHQQDEHPLVPLVATILQSLEPHKDKLSKLADGGKSLLNALVALAHGFSVKVKQPSTLDYEIDVGVSVKDAKEAWEKLKEDPLLKESLQAQALDRLSNLGLGEKLKIVVLIDDLDRCLPDRAIKLLESIKLVLSQPGFIFMLGVSRRIIEGYLEHRYKKRYGIVDFKGVTYLDKIVQLSFPIPPHSGRMEDFSTRLLDRLEDKSDAEALESILPIIGVACDNNPRATVRFVDNLLIDQAINRALAEKGFLEKIPIPFFAITRALQQRWPRMFDLLERSAELCV